MQIQDDKFRFRMTWLFFNCEWSKLCKRCH